MAGSSPSRERHDLLETLAKHRGLLRQTLDGITDEQARRASTVSALCLGGIVKHVTAVEHTWREFMLVGADAFVRRSRHERAALFTPAPHETVDVLLAAYAREASLTDAVVAEVDLDAERLLPPAPWFPPGAAWSARRVVLHLVAETSQHAGHADVVREAIDGAKTMG